MGVFRLPDLGEGLVDAEIVIWHVKEGDEVVIDQILVSVETAKALVDIPSPLNGRIIKLGAQVGARIATHDCLIEFQETESLNSQSPSSTVAGELKSSDEVYREVSPGKKTLNTQLKATALVRGLALRLDVDLNQIAGTGPGGTITSLDVEQAQSYKDLKPLPGYESLRGTRRTMSEVMRQSLQAVVPATLMDEANVQHWPVHTDVTVRLIQALVYAASIEPALNVWLDAEAAQRKIWREVHVGVAWDTPHGLMVPVLHHAEKLDADGLRAQLTIIKEQVLARTISRDDLQGATVVLSNFGKFGGHFATPVVLPPAVAILAAGHWSNRVLSQDQTIGIYRCLPLSLTFDHRAVTGAEAARFLAAVIQQLQDQVYTGPI